MPYRLEKDFQDLIANNSNIQKDICSVLDYKDFKLLREDTYINGITADFTLFERNKLEPL
ncbi:hypothetical protein CYK58_07855 [Helicobacter pylori]|uniref:hypothetical protein n=1 Tax=Helicobacter pylori TaxID=210 RepID=UPI000F7D048E|nr:hypothetical protein [Helicobacter pylori]AZP95391.1 hypothetical protein CYK58_07855 [Helicobacter pylori]